MIISSREIDQMFLSQVLQRLQGEAGREAGQERGRREEALGDQREARWLEE